MPRVFTQVSTGLRGWVSPLCGLPFWFCVPIITHFKKTKCAWLLGENKLKHFQRESENYLLTSCVQGEADSSWGFLKGYVNVFPETAPETIWMGRAARLRVSVERLSQEVKCRHQNGQGCNFISPQWRKGEGRDTTTSGYPGWIPEGPTSCNSRAFPQGRG